VISRLALLMYWRAFELNCTEACEPLTLTVALAPDAHAGDPARLSGCSFDDGVSDFIDVDDGAPRRIPAVGRLAVTDIDGRLVLLPLGSRITADGATDGAGTDVEPMNCSRVSFANQYGMAPVGKSVGRIFSTIGRDNGDGIISRSEPTMSRRGLL